MTQNPLDDVAPWPPGAELRVYVDDLPEYDYLPCMPFGINSKVIEIPNTDWVTYVEPVYFEDNKVSHKFLHRGDEVYISKALFKYLVYIPRRRTVRRGR